MRIGIDAHMLGDHSGGNESFYSGLLDALDTDDGNEYYLFLRKGYYGERFGKRFKLIYFKSDSAFVRNFVELSALCLRLKLDLLHTQYYIPFIRPCPVVCTIHDISFEHHKEWFSRAECIRNRILVPYSARKSKRIITVSEFSKKDIAEKYHISEEKISVIYNAVDSDASLIYKEEKDKIRRRYAIGSDEYIVFVGNIQPRKNISRLIDGYRRFREKGRSDIKLVLIGKNGNPKYKKLQKELEGDKDIIFTGYVPKRDLRILLYEARGLIYPTLFEGFGIPPMEAVVSDIPAAVSDIPVLHETLGDNVIYFDPLSVEDISLAIDKLIKEKQSGDAGDNAAEIKMKYSWSKSADKLKAVYRCALA